MKKLILAPLLILFSLLPLSVLRGIGSIVGIILLKFSKRAGTRLRRNLLLTGMTKPEQVNQLAKDTARELGRTFIETLCIAWHRSKQYNAKFVLETINFAAVQQAAISGAPIVFLTPHIGNFEISLKYTANKIARKFTVLYKPSRKKWLDELMLIGRTEDNITAVPTTRQGVLTLVKALRNKEIIGVLPDSVASSGDGVWVEFFGQPVFATTLAAKMVITPGAVTFIVASRRVPGGFIVEYVPYTPVTTDIPTLVQDLYREFEKMVRQAPAQYYWSYDRFRVPRHAQPLPIKDN